MQYLSLPGMSKKISAIVQGTVMLSSENEAGAFELLDAVYELGCTTFDTAHVYGNGEVERVLGRWIKANGIREQVVILDKGAHHNQDRKRVTPFDIASDIHDSLARLQTDHIDLYALHRDDPSAPVGPVMEALNACQRAGKIGLFGASNWRAERIAAANAYAAEHGLVPFAFSSPHFSLAAMVEAPWDDCISITGDFAFEQQWYAENGVPVFCWSSLAGGWFSGRFTRENAANHAEELCMRCYCSEDNWQRLDRARQLGAEIGATPAQIALAYARHQAFNTIPLVAAYAPAEFTDLTRALDIVFTDEDAAWLDLRSDSRRAG